MRDDAVQTGLASMSLSDDGNSIDIDSDNTDSSYADDNDTAISDTAISDTEISDTEISDTEISDTEISEIDMSESDSNDDEEATNDENANPFEGITYSQDDAISAVLDFYHFLTKLYLDESEIEEAPTDGWPGSAEAPWDVGKSDDIVSLLRHFPVLENGPEVVPYATFAPGVHQDNGGHCTSLTEDCLNRNDAEITVPPYMVEMSSGGRECPSILIDVKHGVVLWHECEFDRYDKDILHESIRVWVDSGYFAKSEFVWIARCSVWPIAEFFEVLKDHFRRLNFFPMNKEKIGDIDWGNNVQQNRFQQIFREHGWPDEVKYDKERCMGAVQEYDEDSDR